jgi:membrane-associated phospholipid phosphatase/serine/threonine protein kinase
VSDPTTVDVTPGPEPATPSDTLPEPVDGRRRRRRPTGAPPALPRSIGLSGKLWLFLSVVLLIWVPAALAFPAVLRLADRTDTAMLKQIARLRTEWLTTVADRIDRLGSGWTLTVILGVTIILLLVFRRWRHLFVLLGSVTVLELLGQVLYTNFHRPRPYGVTTIGRWSGFSMPSPPVAIFAAFLIGVAYTLVVPGRPRTMAKWIIGVLVAAFVGSRLYLAIDHPSDVVVAVTLGVAIPLVAFRFFTPNSVFPVAYKRGKTAHLDVGGRRGEAIRQAVKDQLGIEVLEVGHIGLAGSGGSTPIRMRVASTGDEPEYLFAKLYAMSHVRSDRWYKLGRTILYGRLEDESSFQSVRRLAEYEDYAARIFTDVGIPTAKSYGIVELTPEREYLLVTEFFDDAQEIGDATIDDEVIDECLTIVRRLWDAGLAHRDIKPANILVRHDHVLLIDVAFVQVRPSPWRQAVDLANMMLVLGVRTNAERVYRHALRFFTPDDIAEAFAAARGVASPSQLRAALKHDGRNLIEEFRELGPSRRPIVLQRWSVRRVALVVGLVVAAVLVVSQLATMLRPAHDIPVSAKPSCGTSDLMVLVAQSVPSATLVPCVATLPAGWKVEDVHVQRGHTTFSLDSEVAGKRAVEVELTPPDECAVSSAEPVPSDEVGTRRYERPEQLTPALVNSRYYTFPGGCVTYRFTFKRATAPGLVFDADQALAFRSRETLVRAVESRSDLKLCGAGVTCPGGDGS